MTIFQFPMPETVSRVNGKETKTGVGVLVRDDIWASYPTATYAEIDANENLIIGCDGRTLAIFPRNEWVRVESATA